MQRSTLIGICLASSLLASASWAAPSGDRDLDAASGPMGRSSLDITCSGPGFDNQAGSPHDLKLLIGPEANAAQRRVAMRRLFTMKAHYRSRDGLTDYE